MENFALLIKKFREERGMTQKELAEKAKIGSGTIGDIERGDRKGKISTLDKISKALNLTQTEKNRLDNAFLGRTTSEIKFIDDTLITVPVLAVASAGNGQINFEETPIKKISIPKNGYDEGTYLIEVNGESMEPIIKDGSFIVINPKDTEIQNDKIYVINYDGQIYIKKVIVNTEIKAIILKSINPKYEDKFITENMLEHFKIIGRAVGFILTGKL